jgi:hypothetical protein
VGTAEKRQNVETSKRQKITRRASSVISPFDVSTFRRFDVRSDHVLCALLPVPAIDSRICVSATTFFMR